MPFLGSPLFAVPSPSSILTVALLYLLIRPLLLSVQRRSLRLTTLLILASLVLLNVGLAFEMAATYWTQWYSLFSFVLFGYSGVYFDTLLAGLVLAALSFVAIWVNAYTRWLACVPLLLATALLFPLWTIHAFDLLLFIITLWLLVGVGVQVTLRLHRWSDQPGASHTTHPLFQFSLSRLLSSLYLIAVYMALLNEVRLPTQNDKSSFAVTTVGTAMLVLVSIWSVYAKTSPWRRVLAVAILWLIISTTSISPVGNSGIDWPDSFVMVWPLAYLVLVLLVVTWLAIAKAARFQFSLPQAPEHNLAPPGPLARPLFFGLTAVAVLPLAFSYLAVLQPVTPPQVVLPHPNAHAQLIELLQDLPPLKGPPDPSLAARRQRVLERSALLAGIRKTLDDPSWALVDYSMVDNPALQTLTTGRSGALIEMCYDAAIVAAANGNFDEAFDVSLDLARLSRVISRGGIGWHTYVASECEQAGYVGMFYFRHAASPHARQQAIVLIQQIDRQREAHESVGARTALWHARLGGWDARLQLRVDDVYRLSLHFVPTTMILNLPPEWRWPDAWSTTLLLNRLMQLELALNAHKDLYGEYPSTSQRLIPEFLDHLPHDPFTDEPLYYVGNQHNYLLYSAGPNGVDDHADFMLHPVHRYPIDIQLEQIFASRTKTFKSALPSFVPTRHSLTDCSSKALAP